MSAVAVLDDKIHSRLIQNLDEIALMAGIPKFMLKTSAAEYCSEDELEWLKSFRKHRALGNVGWVYVGTHNTTPIELKFMAMAAALVRNFIDARVVPVSELIVEQSMEAPNPSVLFVPNFYTVAEGKPLASWQLQQLHSLLLRRFVAQKATVLYVQNLDKMETHYGEGIGQHVRHYSKLGG